MTRFEKEAKAIDSTSVSLVMRSTDNKVMHCTPHYALQEDEKNNLILT